MGRQEDIIAVKMMIEELSKAVKEEISNAKFDKTTTGRVIESLPNNYYVVEFAGNKATVKGSVNAAFNVGDNVKVKIPQNNIVNAYIEPKTGNNRDPYDAEYSHSHTNKSQLDRLTKQNIDDIQMIENKVDKVDGKGLSTNDFTNEYKQSIEDLKAGSGSIQSDYNVTDTTSPAFIKNKPSIPTSSENLTDANQIMKTNKVYVINGGNDPSHY